MITFSLLFSVCILISASESKNISSDAVGSARDSRVFSLFSIVSFKNTGCRSQSALTRGQSSTHNGTCYTSSECSSKGGSANGNCAAGFGVCCVFLITSGDVTQNCTYIRNDGFPSRLTTTTPANYVVHKVTSDVCYIRLDMETFNILGPVNEDGGGACIDTMKITVNPGPGQKVPIICGYNNGQHIYINIGNIPTNNLAINFNFPAALAADAPATARTWEIKVSQIECNNKNRPPDGCLQYFTTASGRISTFNFFNDFFPHHISSQDVTACIRQQSGYCCIEYKVCNDFTDAFSLDGVVTLSSINTQCTLDYVAIPGATGSCGSKDTLFNKFCSQMLQPDGFSAFSVPVCDCSPPFLVSFHTDAKDEGTLVLPAVANGQGVCLDYTLKPC